MDRQYIDDDLQKFFEHWKQLPSDFGIEKVHQIINNPDAKAKWKGNSFFKPLNLIMMTTMFITGVTIISMWFSHDQAATEESVNKTETQKASGIHQQNTEKQPVSLQKNHLTGQNAWKANNNYTNDLLLTPTLTNTNVQEVEPKEALTASLPANCTWPKDTMLDKNSLMVKLSKEEQERIGLFYRVDSTKIPQMDKFSSLYKNGIHMALGPNHKGGSFEMYGYRKNFHYIRAFNAVHISNHSCSNKRWNSPFYSEIDTLLPVIVNNDIYWFLAIPQVMDSLPDRYTHLKAIYTNLKCLKKQSPEKQLVNYWNRNMILGNVKYLELSREELANIGIIFDSTRLGYRVEDAYTHKKFFTYRINGAITNTTSSRDTVFPQSLPIISTDEKGLNQRFFCRSSKGNAFQVDLFVPVKIPLNEYVDGITYYEIYWFNPTDSFINLLPDRMKYQLKNEKEGILKKMQQSSNTCTFFEACKSTLQVNDLRVYPNPAKDKLTIEFSSKEDLAGNISITNMAGVEIRQLMSNAPIRTGSNTFNVDLSGLPSGFFIISINTNKGFKTQRVIISQ